VFNLNTNDDKIEKILFEHSKNLRVPVKTVLEILLKIEEIEVKQILKRRNKNGKISTGILGDDEA
jgi:hypothetical protein